MHAEEDAARLIERDLRNALVLELFVELGFIVALLAVAGLFNGGRSTGTPLIAVAYLAAGPLVTVVVTVRTWQMLNLARQGDIEVLRGTNMAAWAVVAFVFSAILPAIYLNSAAARLQRGS